jgi:hypothetical protein
VLARTISVPRFPSVREGYSEVNNFRFDEFFDLANAVQVDLRQRRLPDLLIHSLVFVEVLGEEETYDAFMVTSDHEQAKGLIQVVLAANDYPTAITFARSMVLKTLFDERAAPLCGRGRSVTYVSGPYT